MALWADAITNSRMTASPMFSRANSTKLGSLCPARRPPAFQCGAAHVRRDERPTCADTRSGDTPWRFKEEGPKKDPFEQEHDFFSDSNREVQ